MEKQFNREDRLMKKLLDEAGSEKPSADFKRQIMAKLESRNAKIRPYKPLISRRVWMILAGLMLSSIAGLYIMNSDLSLSFEVNFGFLNALDIPQIDLSRTMQYAIAFVALFLLEVPLLKRFLDRQYEF